MLTARVVIETSVQLYPSASPGLRQPGNKRYSVNSDVSHLDKADDSLSRNILSHFLMRLFCVILSRWTEIWWQAVCFFPPRLLRGGESACLRQVSVYLHTEEVCVMGGGLNARHWRPFYTHILCMCLCVCVLELSVWRLGANTPGQRHGPRRLGCEQLLPPCTLSAVLSFLPVPSLQNTQISVNIGACKQIMYLLKVAALKRLHELCWCFYFSSSAVSAFLEGWTWGHRGRGC